MKTLIVPCIFAGSVLTSALAPPSLAQPVDVDINWNIEHRVGGVSDFGRDRHITVHSALTDPDWDGEEDKLDYLLNDLDVYLGRDNGAATWKFKATTQDPERPNMADLDFMANFSAWWDTQYDAMLDRHQYESRGQEMIMGSNAHPTYPTLSWYDNAFTWDGWQPKNIETSAEWMVNYLDLYFRRTGETSGELPPMYWEVINEPDMALMTGQFMVSSWEALWEYHNLVADGVRDRMGDEAPLIGGMTWGLHDLYMPDLSRYASNYLDAWIEDPAGAQAYREAAYTEYPPTGAWWEQWDTVWEGFVDHAGSNMDFYAVHLYDWPGWQVPGDGALRAGGHVEATLDTLEWYDVHSFGVSNRNPIVLSEYGAVAGYQEQLGLDQRRLDWESLKPFNSMLMQFLERPDYIVKSMPFTPTKATWGDYTVGNDLYRYPYTMLDETTPGSGVWAWTEYIKFYELWSDVDGTRVDTRSGDLDIQVDAYVEGHTGYLVLNNLEPNTKTIKLNAFGAGGNAVSSVRVKHLYLDLTQGAEGRPALSDQTLLTPPGSVTLGADATMVLQYTFAGPVVPDETAVETKYYGENLSGTTPFRVANSSISAQINGVTVPAGPAEVTLRITGMFWYDFVTMTDPRNQVTINGTTLDYVADWRGEKGGRPRWFGTLEIPVPVAALQVNNTITADILNECVYSCVGLQVSEFSQAPGRSATAANVPVTGISLAPGTLSMPEQRTSSVLASITPADAGDTRITWTSSNPAVATVDALGMITAVAEGSATITATTVDGGLADTVAVTVTAFVPFPVTGVRVNPANRVVLLGETANAVATVLPENAGNQAVSWDSSNPSAATVDASGVITAVGEGAATVTATTADGGFTDSVTVTVPPPVAVTGVTVSPETALIVSGSSLQLSATVLPREAYEQSVTWASLNPTVATVSTSGLVSAVGEGFAEIRVTTVEGGHTASCVVTVFVVGPDGVSVTVEAEDFDLTGGVRVYTNGSDIGINYVEANDWAEYNINVPSNGIYKVVYHISTPLDGSTITLQLDGTSVALDTVPNNGDWDAFVPLQSSGYVAMSAGAHTMRLVAGSNAWQWNLDKAVLTRIAEGGAPVPVDGVAVSPTSSVMGQGTTTRLSATVSPVNASNKSVTWNSLHPAVASVDADGLVSGATTGMASIVVTTVDGGFAATGQVTVTPGAAVDGVTVSPPTSVIAKGTTVQLSDTVSPPDALDKSVTWSSLNPSVATVSSSGLVSGLAEGTAFIVVTTTDGGFTATNETTVTVPPGVGPVIVSYLREGADTIMGVTNGVADASFDVFSASSLADEGGWTVLNSNLLFDAAGGAMVTNPVAGSRQFLRILDSGGPPPLAVTFDFENQPVGGDWDKYIEQTVGDYTISGTMYGIMRAPPDTDLWRGGFAFVGGAEPANLQNGSMTLSHATLGGDQEFTVQSVEIETGGDAIMTGLLNGGTEWTIVPSGTGDPSGPMPNYTLATTGHLGSPIDEVRFSQSGTGWNNRFDNLVVEVTAP